MIVLGIFEIDDFGKPSFFNGLLCELLSPFCSSAGLRAEAYLDWSMTDFDWLLDDLLRFLLWQRLWFFEREEEQKKGN
jgi:hypothetical protein